MIRKGYKRTCFVGCVACLVQCLSPPSCAFHLNSWSILQNIVLCSNMSFTQWLGFICQLVFMFWQCRHVFILLCVVSEKSLGISLSEREHYSKCFDFQNSFILLTNNIGHIWHHFIFKLKGHFKKPSMLWSLTKLELIK